MVTGNRSKEEQKAQSILKDKNRKVAIGLDDEYGLERAGLVKGKGANTSSKTGAVSRNEKTEHAPNSTSKHTNMTPQMAYRMGMAYVCGYMWCMENYRKFQKRK